MSCGLATDYNWRIKVDIRLIPVLIILYLIAHIDRANIGNAKIEGLIEDLGLTGTQYNVALAMFFPSCEYHYSPVADPRLPLFRIVPEYNTLGSVA